MNKKVITNLILGIVVVGIYANAVKGIVNGLKDEDPVPPQVRVAAKNPPFDDYAPKKDTAHLLLNYRDPFRAASTQPVKDPTRTIASTARAAVRNMPRIEDLSFIKYSGFIYTPSSKKTISVLSINGQSTMVADGESAAGIKLVRNMGDSVKIIYKNKIRFIKRS